MNLTIFLGYLGSGKTTLLKNLLSLFKNSKNAVIVNDFGKEDVDGKILASYTENLKTIFDGSIFCSCKSDQFVSAVLEVAKTNPDNIFVEASGLANPFTMLDVLDLINSKLENKVFLKGVVCLVDAANFEKILSAAHMIKMQVAAADLIIVNKIDCVSEVTLNRVEKIIRQFNDFAEIVKTVKADVQKFDLSHRHRILPNHVSDLKIQKLMLQLNGHYTQEQLHNFCLKISGFSHRIKGIVNLGSESYLYQFSDGASELIPYQKSQGYLIVLSCMKENLKKKVEDALKEFDFAVITEP